MLQVQLNFYYLLLDDAPFPEVMCRWMAPEAATNGRYSTASDVWAFGVLVYEIFTKGEMPYIGKSFSSTIIFKQ